MDRVTLYEANDGEFRWHRKSENGRIVSESGEGYTDKEDARRMMTMLHDGQEVEFVDTTVGEAETHGGTAPPDA